jgi:hypothetical protein
MQKKVSGGAIRSRLSPSAPKTWRRMIATTMPAAAHSIQAGKNEPNIFCAGDALQPARHRAVSCLVAIFRCPRFNRLVPRASIIYLSHDIKHFLAGSNRPRGFRSAADMQYWDIGLVLKLDTYRDSCTSWGHCQHRAAHGRRPSCVPATDCLTPGAILVRCLAGNAARRKIKIDQRGGHRFEYCPTALPS